MIEPTKTIEQKILTALKKSEWPLTTRQAAKQAGLSWQTTQIALFKLLSQGKVVFQKSGKHNQWRTK